MRTQYQRPAGAACIEVLEGRMLLSGAAGTAPSTIESQHSGLLAVKPALTVSPSAPSNLSAVVVSGVQVSLAWKNNSDETAYPKNQSGTYVNQSSDGGKTWLPLGMLDPTAQSCAVGGLQLNTAYSFRVYAFNPHGVSSYSNIASVKTSAQLTSAKFTNGFGGFALPLTLSGSAVLSGSSLQLTDATNWEAGSAFFSNPLPIQAFSTTFTFQLTNATAGADGFTFTIQGNAPSTVGIHGGGLGYQAIPKSVAVKFDLYDNVHGQSGNSTGLYFNGIAPDATTGGSTAASIDLGGTPIKLHSGHVFRVDLSYGLNALTETITDTTTNGVWSHTYTSVNIPSLVGGNIAYVGFTGATGGLTAVQKIQSWTYASTAASISGSVFKDTNGNGTLDTGEAGLAGWTVYLDTNNNGKLDAGELTVTTDAKGNYSFVVPAGKYNVREVVKSGFTRTVPSAGVYAITLTSGQSGVARNFGDR